jgi:hypothetical protein
MTTTTFAQDLVWYTNSPILFLTAFILYRRHLARLFPYFVVYLVFVGFKSYALIPVSKYSGFSSSLFFYGSWGSTLISIGLTFVILYEVVRNVFTSGTLKISRSNFMLLTALLLLAAAVLSTQMPALSDVPVMKGILAARNALRLEQIALLVVLAIATVFFGFYWGNLAFGIAAGFGVYASMDLVSGYVRGRLGIEGTHMSNLIDTWSYQIAAFIWLFYALKKQGTPPGGVPPNRSHDLAEHVESMMK